MENLLCKIFILFRFIQVEGQATEILESKLGLKKELETLQMKVGEKSSTTVVDNSEELAKVVIL